MENPFAFPMRDRWNGVTVCTWCNDGQLQTDVLNTPDEVDCTMRFKYKSELDALKGHSATLHLVRKWYPVK